MASGGRAGTDESRFFDRDNAALELNNECRSDHLRRGKHHSWTDSGYCRTRRGQRECARLYQSFASPPAAPQTALKGRSGLIAASPIRLGTTNAFTCPPSVTSHSISPTSLLYMCAYLGDMAHTTHTKPLHVIIIGAGISGLAAAYGLQDVPGVHVRLLEKRKGPCQ